MARKKTALKLSPKRKRWPKGAKKSHLVTVQVRDVNPSPTLASMVRIAEFCRVRRTKAWWKRHIEEILRVEAYIVHQGYMDILEYLRDQAERLNHERKEFRGLSTKLDLARRKLNGGKKPITKGDNKSVRHALEQFAYD